MYPFFLGHQKKRYTSSYIACSPKNAALRCRLCLVMDPILMCPYSILAKCSNLGAPTSNLGAPTSNLGALFIWGPGAICPPCPPPPLSAALVLVISFLYCVLQRTLLVISRSFVQVQNFCLYSSGTRVLLYPQGPLSTLTVPLALENEGLVNPLCVH